MKTSTTLVLKRKYPSFTLQQKLTAKHFIKEFLCVHDSLRCSESPTYMYKIFALYVITSLYNGKFIRKRKNCFYIGKYELL